jgi:hypothetical protein
MVLHQDMSQQLSALPKEEHVARLEVIREALTWTGTPFQNGARVKGAGAECGSYIVDAFAIAGFAKDYKLPNHNVAWHLHKDSPNFDPDMYTREIEKFATEVPGPPLPADVAIFWWGHAYSHGAIVIEWPTKLIHCFPVGGVQLVDATRDPFLKRFRQAHPPKFYNAFLGAKA